MTQNQSHETARRQQRRRRPTHSRTSLSKRPRIDDSPDEENVIEKAVIRPKKNKKQKKAK